MAHPLRETESATVKVSAPALFYVAVLVLTYGYEIFAFNLSVDEELFGAWSSKDYALIWLQQGRWSMALVTLLLPTPVVPAVTLGLGIILSGVAWWALCRRVLRLAPCAAALAASLAGTLPVLPFIFSFSTIAHGIGVANVLLVVFAWSLDAKSWWWRGAGTVALAGAIGVYDPFLLAGAALALGYLVHRGRWRSAPWAIGSVLLGFVVSRVVGGLFKLVRPSDDYTSQFIDLEGFLRDPGARLLSGLSNVWDVVSLAEEKFSLHSPWLAFAAALLGFLALLGIFIRSHDTEEMSVQLVSLLLISAIPVVAESMLATTVTRSMVYLPFVVLAIAGLAWRGVLSISDIRWRKSAMFATALVIATAILGQATIANRLFAASETTEAHDQNLAFLIGYEKDRLLNGDNWAETPIVISGNRDWWTSKLTPSQETFGRSFFSSTAGNKLAREVGYLRAQGVAVVRPTAQQQSAVEHELEAMPSYPSDGWIALSDGVLLVKLGQQ